jgi:3-methylcrotonyl-CoA carboxylase alpha subunit
LQLAIAAGERLPLRQEDITPRGHAIEVRLYAEDPANGYLPSTGKVLTFVPPRAPGVRVDAGIAAGDEVTVHYDPMLAKLIVYAEDRPAAVARLGWALDRCAVLGVATNISLLRAIAREEDFAAGNATTAYLETHDLTEATKQHQAPAEALVAAALWEMIGTPAEATATGGRPYNPWTRGGATLGGAGGERRFRYAGSGGEHVVLLRPTDDGSAYSVQVDGAAYPGGGPPVSGSVGLEGAITLRAGNNHWHCVVVRRDYEVLVFYQGRAYTLAKPRPLDVDTAAHHGEVASGTQVLVAPMAGTVVKVNVAEGDRVEGRQTLVVLGAMKMEHAVVAPYAGRVRRVPHKAGDVVPGGEILVELEASAGS